MKPITYEYKGEWRTRVHLQKLPEFKTSAHQFARNIANGQNVAEAMQKGSPEKISKMRKNEAKKRARGRIQGQLNKPKLEKSELPVYSKQEALAIMSVPVNPNYCRYHRFGTLNNPLDAIRRRSRIR